MSRDFTLIKNWVKSKEQQPSFVTTRPIPTSVNYDEQATLMDYQPSKGAIVHFKQTSDNTAKLIPGKGWELNMKKVMSKINFTLKTHGGSSVMVMDPQTVQIFRGLQITAWTVSVDPEKELFTDKITWQFVDQFRVSFAGSGESVVTTYSWPIYQPV